MPKSQKNLNILVGFIVLIMVLLFLEFNLLGFDLLQSDPLSYWRDSLNWQTPYNKFHVPFYPLMIAFFRGLTFNLFHPLVYMIAITTSSLALGLFSILKISRIISSNSLSLNVSFFLFAFWPLAGIYAIVYPLADYVVISLFLFGLSLILQEKSFWGSLVWGLALITHKAIWPFVAISFLIFTIREIKKLGIKWLLYLVPVGLPISLLFIGGTHYYSDWKWMFSGNVNELHNNELIIPLKGIIDSFLIGDLPSIFKGLVISFFLVVTIILVFCLFKNKPLYFHYGLGICFVLLFMALFLREAATWPFARFSRLLIFPLLIAMSDFLNKFKLRIFNPMARWLILVIGFLLVISQFAFVFYMARYYFA